MGLLLNTVPDEFADINNFMDYSKNLLKLISYDLTKIPKKYKKYTLELSFDIHALSLNLTIDNKIEMTLEYKIKNTDRTVGAILSNEISKNMVLKVYLKIP